MANIELNWTKLTSLTKENIEGLPGIQSGVYRLSYKHPDSKVYVFYVGKSDNIKRSLTEHLSDNEPNPGVRSMIRGNECFFKYATIEDEKDRTIVYGLVCKFYHPSCNLDRPDTDENFTININ